jgi:hypothetical protein
MTDREQERERLAFILDSTVDLPADKYDRETLIMRLADYADERVREAVGEYPIRMDDETFRRTSEGIVRDTRQADIAACKQVRDRYVDDGGQELACWMTAQECIDALEKLK